jgi:hypothetical protein
MTSRAHFGSLRAVLAGHVRYARHAGHIIHLGHYLRQICAGIYMQTIVNGGAPALLYGPTTKCPTVSLLNATAEGMSSLPLRPGKGGACTYDAGRPGAALRARSAAKTGTNTCTTMYCIHRHINTLWAPSLRAVLVLHALLGDLQLQNYPKTKCPNTSLFYTNVSANNVVSVCVGNVVALRVLPL